MATERGGLNGFIGITGDAHARLRAYALGEPLEDDPGLLQRVGCLLSIYRLLGVLYPENAEIRAQWMRSRDRRFGGDTPADIGRRDGLEGLETIQAELTRMCAG